MKKILSIIITIFMVMSLCACSGNSDNDTPSTSSRYELVGNVDMSVDYDSYFGYSVEIKGKLKNKSSNDFSYVSVTFAIYDAEGNQIETALDNINYLQAGSVWSFNASMFGWTDVEPISCKLVEVNAW